MNRSTIRPLAILVFHLLACNFLFSQHDNPARELAREKLEAGDLRAAFRYAQQAVAYDSMDTWAYDVKSDVELEIGKVDWALLTLRECISRMPDSSHCYNRLGALFVDLNELDSSLFYFGKAIELVENEQTKIRYLINRATAKGTFRDFRGGINDLEMVLRMRPNNPVALTNVANLYCEVGENKKAIATMKKVIALAPDFIGTYINLGMLYSDLDSLELSKKYFDLAAQIDPDQPLLLSNRGFLLCKMKQYDAAMRDLRKSAEIYPSNSYVYRNMAHVYLATGKKEKACEELRRAKELDFHLRYGDEVDKLLTEHCQD